MTPEVATDETYTLISSDKVAGTPVFDYDREKLGEIHTVMIDKRRGVVSYAVMSFGGFLGIGEKYHPLPWPTLVYDEESGGYVVNLSRVQLEGAPQLERDELGRLEDRHYGEQIHSHYGIPPYWTGKPIA